MNALAVIKDNRRRGRVIQEERRKAHLEKGMNRTTAAAKGATSTAPEDSSTLALVRSCCDGRAGRGGFSQPLCAGMWSDASESHAFALRSRTFLDDKVKARPGEAIGRLVAFHLYRAAPGCERIDHAASRGKLGRLVRELGQLTAPHRRPQEPAFFIVNIQVPGQPPTSLVLVFALPWALGLLDAAKRRSPREELSAAAGQHQHQEEEEEEEAAAVSPASFQRMFAQYYEDLPVFQPPAPFPSPLPTPQSSPVRGKGRPPSKAPLAMLPSPITVSDTGEEEEPLSPLTLAPPPSPARTRDQEDCEVGAATAAEKTTIKTTKTEAKPKEGGAKQQQQHHHHHHHQQQPPSWSSLLATPTKSLSGSSMGSSIAKKASSAGLAFRRATTGGGSGGSGGSGSGKKTRSGSGGGGGLDQRERERKRRSSERRRGRRRERRREQRREQRQREWRRRGGGAGGILQAASDGAESPARSFRNERFKCLPRIVDGPWVVKKAVPSSKPALLGKKLTQRYFRGECYVETDVHIGSSHAARGITKLCRGASSRIVVDLGFCLEARTAAELPEQLIGAARLTTVDLRAAELIDEDDEDEENNGDVSSDDDEGNREKGEVLKRSLRRRKSWQRGRKEAANDEVQSERSRFVSSSISIDDDFDDDNFDDDDDDDDDDNHVHGYVEDYYAKNGHARWKTSECFPDDGTDDRTDNGSEATFMSFEPLTYQIQPSPSYFSSSNNFDVLSTVAKNETRPTLADKKPRTPRAAIRARVNSRREADTRTGSSSSPRRQDHDRPSSSNEPSTSTSPDDSRASSPVVAAHHWERHGRRPHHNDDGNDGHGNGGAAAPRGRHGTRWFGCFGAPNGDDSS